MKDIVTSGNTVTPMLFPIEPEQFLTRIRQVIREEVDKLHRENPAIPVDQTPGMTYKPLYKIKEICDFFQVTKTTIYSWIRDGKLKPYKVKSRVYFLHNDVQKLLNPDQETP